MAEPVPSRPRPVALDTNVIFHLAEEYAPAHNLVLRLVRQRYSPIVTQTVIEELGYAAEHETAKKKQLAIIGLTNLRGWGISTATFKPVGNGITDRCADVIAYRGLLPEEERNDALVFVEASFYQVAMLLTWDRHLNDADNAALNAVLTSLDLFPVTITHPSKVLTYAC